MLHQILSVIEKYDMISPGDEVVAALSGGADSVCLLLALDALSERLQISLSAIHVNHCIRGEESDRDEQFCRDLCTRLGIPFTCGRFDVVSIAKERKLSLETAARDVRYAFFAEKTAGKKIATAHNANDNAETVILNLVRGTGTKGIAGIPPVRDNIIRPLLGCDRSDIENFLEERGQEYMTDSTNLSDDYTRNTIRHNVIPVLKKFNSALSRTMLSNSDNFRTDNSFLEEETKKAYAAHSVDKHTLKDLNSLHPAIRRRCILKLLSENGIEFGSRRIADLEYIVMNRGKINLMRDIFAVSENDTLALKKLCVKDPCLVQPVPLKPGENLFLNKTVEASFENFDGNTEGIIMDIGKLEGLLMLRSRLPGDRIKLEGRDFTSSVKKLMNSRKDITDRDSVVFICDDNGPVFIEHFGIADRVKITNSTKKIMRIRVVCEETMKF